METEPGPPRQRPARPLPKHPHERDALRWTAVAQGHRGKAACCRACTQSFEVGELRLARESDANAGASRWLHLHCIPGGLHAQDEILGAVLQEPAIATAIAAARQPEQESADDSGRPSSSDMEVDSSSFWTEWRWQQAYDCHIKTLISVPDSLRRLDEGPRQEHTRIPRGNESVEAG
jgi:hypothetical protein